MYIMWNEIRKFVSDLFVLFFNGFDSNYFFERRSFRSNEFSKFEENLKKNLHFL